MKIRDDGGLGFSVFLYREIYMFCNISHHIACFSSPFVFLEVLSVELLPRSWLTG